MNIDLFTPVVPQDRFHKAFSALYGGAKGCEREVLNGWADGFVDRDGKFVKEFQTTFDSSFWELYLHAAFTELGFRSDFQQSRPDFCIITPELFNVEATVSLHASGTSPVTETNPLEMPRDYNEFNRQAIIRLSNSIHSKHKKYLESYSQLSHVGDRPFVIAVAPFDRPHFYLQAQRAVEALLYRYYVDEENYLRTHPNRDVPLRPQDLSHVTKDSGAKLDLGLFCNESMPEISAVIQSSAATWSKVRAMSDDPDVMIEAIYEDRANGGMKVFRGPNERYEESVLDGLRVYHNPFAKNPLDPSLFSRPEIFQATATGPVSMVLLSDSRHILVNRKATLFPPGMMQKAIEDIDPEMNFWHSDR